MSARFHWQSVAALTLAAAASTGCGGDRIVAPERPEVMFSPQTQWSGGEIILQSDAFRDLSLQPLLGADGTTVPKRWSNFAVVIDGDTTDTRRTAVPDQIAFRVPALLTGEHTATVEVAGQRPVDLFFHSVGQAREPTATLSSVTNTYEGQVMVPGMVLTAEEVGVPVEGALLGGTGYVLINVNTGDPGVLIPELTASQTTVVQMYVPGPSYRQNHFVFDLSPLRASDPQVWRTTPEFAPVNSIQCASRNDQNSREYTAAEVAPGVCLLAQGMSIWRNGNELITSQRALYNAQFRMAAGGRWTVALTRSVTLVGQEPLTEWSVFDSTGAVAYTVSRYARVPGAAFSADGAKMYLVAKLQSANGQPGEWVLQMLDAATGSPLASVAFPGATYLYDVLLDPVKPVLYVVSREDSIEPTTPPNFISESALTFHVIDQSTLNSIAAVPAVLTFPGASAVGLGPPGFLVHGGSTGRVHLMLLCGADCGGLWNWAFDTM